MIVSTDRLAACLDRPISPDIFSTSYRYIEASERAESCACEQWQVDARTPGSVLEDLAARLRAHYDKHSGEFAAPPKVSFTGTGDPLKIQLSVSFELTHNGMLCHACVPNLLSGLGAHTACS